MWMESSATSLCYEALQVSGSTPPQLHVVKWNRLHWRRSLIPPRTRILRSRSWLTRTLKHLNLLGQHLVPRTKLQHPKRDIPCALGFSISTQKLPFPSCYRWQAGCASNSGCLASTSIWKDGPKLQNPWTHKLIHRDQNGDLSQGPGC